MFSLFIYFFLKVVAEKLKDSNYFYKRIASTGLTSLNVKMHVKKTADELLFKGYEDNMIDLINRLPKFLFSNSGMPDMDKFGWFYKVILLKILVNLNC